MAVCEAFLAIPSTSPTKGGRSRCDGLLNSEGRAANDRV